MATVVRSDNVIQVYTQFADLEYCRRVVGGKWNKKQNCWEYPLTSLPMIVEQFPSVTIDSTAKPILEKLRMQEQAVQDLRTGKAKPRPHPFLMEHQRLCRDIARYMPRFGLMLDTGTGKTITAFSIIEEYIALKWIVISPKSIIKTAWMSDHIEFFPNLRVLPLSKNIKTDDYRAIAERWGVKLQKRSVSDLQDELLPHAEVVIINPESFKTDARLNQWPHSGLIVDESSILRNFKTQTTKAVVEHARRMRRVYLLSGKPAPNSELEYFTQMQVINPSLFGESFYKFRDRFFRQVDYFGYDYALKEDMKQEFSNRLYKGCIFMNKKDCLELPPEMPPVMRMIELAGDALKYYKQMEKTQLVVLEDKEIPAMTKLASMMKLRQITSGFIIDTAEDSTPSVLHTAKINELREVVNELGTNKAIIWVNFKCEVDLIASMLAEMRKTYVTAYSGTKDVDASIEAFKNDTAQFIIAHPKTLKYGVTFTGDSMARNCTYAIYYSMSYSFEDYYQSHDRIYRKGQTESCTYIFLIAENTVDEDIYDAIIKKGSNAEIMENMTRRCRA